MKPFTDELSLEDFEDELSEMLCVSKKYTKLKYDVWLDYQGKERKRKNNSPRLLISLTNDSRAMIPISIDKFNPKILISRDVQDFESVSDWIKKNYSLLIRHWNQEIDDVEMVFLFGDDGDEVSMARSMKQEWGNRLKLEDFIIYPVLLKHWDKQKINRLRKLLNERKAD